MEYIEKKNTFRENKTNFMLKKIRHHFKNSIVPKKNYNISKFVSNKDNIDEIFGNSERKIIKN